MPPVSRCHAWPRTRGPLLQPTPLFWCTQDAYFCTKFVHLLHTMGFVGFSTVMFYNEVRSLQGSGFLEF